MNLLLRPCPGPGGRFPAALLGAVLAAAPVATQSEHTDQVVLLRPAEFPERADLLAEARAAVLAGIPRADLVHALERGSWRATARLRAWVTDCGGEIRAVLWNPHAALVRVPTTRLPELVSRPEVARATADRGHRGRIGVATNAQNHNADFVQQALGLRGAGLALALIDSGVNVDFQGNGVPHPALTDAQGQSRVLFARDVVGAGTGTDVNGHGTEVASIAVGRNWNPQNPLADDGFAPASLLASYRVTRTGSVTASSSDLALGYQAALADRIAGHPIVAANCSYAGSPDPMQVDQIALDTLAWVGDVVVVTSAGNDALLPRPTAESQATLNGLAVGSVAPTSHRVSTSFSSFGPIAGDGARYFPDLMAVGEGLSTVVLNSTAVGTGRQGTSFSAPMVAGTALLVRSARPDFTALDTKTVILNSVQDLAPQNPDLDRNHYGLGMLRADLAVAAARAARTGNAPSHAESWTSRIERGVLVGTGAVQRYPLTVTAGTAYTATVSWFRTAQASTWDDLDLLVLDGQGELVALSATPRNLYERVRFTAARNGIYTLEVRAAAVISSSIDFSLAASQNHGGGVQEGFFSDFGSACQGSAGDPTAAAQPPLATSAFGGARTRIGLSSTPTIVQQAFDATWFAQPLTATKMAFRRAFDFGSVPSWRAELQIRLGYTQRPVGGLGIVLQQNPVPGSMVTVLPRQWVDFEGLEGPPKSHAEFDFAIPLTTPFRIDTQQNGNLLLEITLWQHSQGTTTSIPAWFDAVRGPGYGRVYSLGTGPGSFVLPDPLSMVVSFASDGLPRVAPRLTWSGTPRPGHPFSLSVRDGLPGSLALLSWGTSVLDWSGVPLPLDLGTFGAPGCVVFASIDDLASGTVGADGQLHFDMPIPLDPSLTGSRFFDQIFLLDPAANALGIVSSVAGFGVIGG